MIAYIFSRSSSKAFSDAISDLVIIFRLYYWLEVFRNVDWLWFWGTDSPMLIVVLPSCGHQIHKSWDFSNKVFDMPFFNLTQGIIWFGEKNAEKKLQCLLLVPWKLIEQTPEIGRHKNSLELPRNAAWKSERLGDLGLKKL